MQHRFQNITCRAGQAAPEVYLPAGTSTCPTTQLNKGELHCNAQNITLPKTLLARLPFFFAKFTCNLQQGKCLCCTLIDEDDGYGDDERKIVHKYHYDNEDTFEYKDEYGKDDDDNDDVEDDDNDDDRSKRLYWQMPLWIWWFQRLQWQLWWWWLQSQR